MSLYRATLPLPSLGVDYYISWEGGVRSKKKFMHGIELEKKFLQALKERKIIRNFYTKFIVLFILFHCIYSYLFDAFIKVIQHVPNKASDPCSINMHVLECDIVIV